jgi:hypothetical protein
MAGAAEVAARVLALGREGKGRAEIAAALGVSLQRLRAMEAETAEIGAALRRAETAAQAWWEAMQREALLGGARLNAGAWREAMAWRFGGVGKGGAAPQPAPVLARYEIPDNGKERRRAPRRG